MSALPIYQADIWVHWYINIG